MARNQVKKGKKNKKIKSAVVKPLKGTRKTSSLNKYKELVRLFREPKFEEDIRKVLQSPVNIIVLSTMSAGKSTLLNAMIGSELLPTGNEACTARVCRIEDHDSAEGFFVRLAQPKSPQEWEPASPDMLQKLNLSDAPGIIELRGNIESIQNLGAHLVLYDTPGPNNSRDNQHEVITSQILKDEDYGLVLYLLNATQLGVTDDSYLLQQLQEVVLTPERNKEVVFVLNKADKLDEERGENLGRVIERVYDYLRDHGFVNPTIIPTCAHGAMIARQLQSDMPLTRRERGELLTLLSLFREHPKRLTQVAKTSPSLKAKITRLMSGSAKEVDGKIEKFRKKSTFSLGSESITHIELEQFIASTGIKTLELILQDLLLRQGLPSTINQLNEVFTRHGSSQLAKWINI